MTSHLTYQATLAHIDELRRQAAIATQARPRPDASPRRITEQPRRKLASLRRVLRGLDPRAETR